MVLWFVFNKDSNISRKIFPLKPLFEHTLGEKRPVKQKTLLFHKTNVFSFKFWILYISKISSFLDLKRFKTIRQKLRTTWYNGKLHGSTILGIHMFAKLWNSFP